MYATKGLIAVRNTLTFCDYLKNSILKRIRSIYALINYFFFSFYKT